MAKNGLSIEVFRDYHSIDPNSLSVDPVMASVSGIAKIIGKFDILDTKNLLALTDRPTISINGTRYLFDTESESADLNVVITDRMLLHDNGGLLRGVAHTIPNKKALGSRLAIVSTYENDTDVETIETGYHEIGHILNLRSRRDSAHCDDWDCALNTYFSSEDSDYCIYCDRCASQLPKCVDRLVRAKKGQRVAKRALFPSFYEQFPQDSYFVGKET